MKVDILFCARNRREYTEEALRQLEKNTNWDLVSTAIFWDDAGTYNPYQVPSRFGRILGTELGSPVSVMNAAINGLFDKIRAIYPLIKSPWFAKIDNDTIVPPGWLDVCVAIAETDRADLIGIEARYCDHPPMPAGNTSIIQYRHTDHVGGIGLFRRSPFIEHPLTLPDAVATAHYEATGQDTRYFGFTEWQWAHPDVKKVWIDPPLPVFLLDHLPFEPWRSLGYQYVQKGWQRNSWGEYDAVKDKKLWEWWINL